MAAPLDPKLAEQLALAREMSASFKPASVRGRGGNVASTRTGRGAATRPIASGRGGPLSGSPARGRSIPPGPARGGASRPIARTSASGTRPLGAPTGPRHPGASGIRQNHVTVANNASKDASSSKKGQLEASDTDVEMSQAHDTASVIPSVTDGLASSRFAPSSSIGVEQATEVPSITPAEGQVTDRSVSFMGHPVISIPFPSEEECLRQTRRQFADTERLRAQQAEEAGREDFMTWESDTPDQDAKPVSIKRPAVIYGMPLRNHERIPNFMDEPNAHLEYAVTEPQRHVTVPAGTQMDTEDSMQVDSPSPARLDATAPAFKHVKPAAEGHKGLKSSMWA